MSDDFTGVTQAGNGLSPTTQWSAADSTPATPIFVSFPASSQPAQDEVGYGEGGYGEDGYDAPSIPAITAPITNWSVVTSK